MDADRWRRIVTLLEQLPTLRATECEELIRASCEGDKDFEEELRSLFDARSRIEGFLEEPAIAVAARAMNASETLAMAPHEPGSIVSRYRLLEKIGEGGMGVVYKAEDTRLRRLVALKFLPSEFASDPLARVRFEREARASSALNHPNICTVYNIGEDAAGHSFIAMEYLPGRTLKEILAQETLDVPALLRLGTEVLDALEAAHAAGIVHRDIKPANILITDRGTAKILDFGIARDSQTAFSGAADRDGEFTSIGVVAGTVAYMSPEQACGLELDGRSDLFSLGVVLYEAATQTDVFRRETPALTCNAILNGSPAPLLESVRICRPPSTVSLTRRLKRTARGAFRAHRNSEPVSRGFRERWKPVPLLRCRKNKTIEDDISRTRQPSGPGSRCLQR